MAQQTACPIRLGQMELKELGGRTGGVEDQAHSAGSGTLKAITTGCQQILPAEVSNAESSEESMGSDGEAGRSPALHCWPLNESSAPALASFSTGATRLRPSASEQSTNSQTGLEETPVNLTMTNMIQTVLIQVRHVVV